MHARVTTGVFQPENVDEMARIYQSDIVPVIATQQGFKGVYLLIDRSSGESISLTLWASETDGQAYEASGAYKAQVDKLRHLFTAAPSLKTYETVVQALAPARVSS